jgi:hypothetical protein
MVFAQTQSLAMSGGSKSDSFCTVKLQQITGGCLSIDEQDEERHGAKCDKNTTSGLRGGITKENWPSCNVSNMDKKDLLHG